MNATFERNAVLISLLACAAAGSASAAPFSVEGPVGSIKLATTAAATPTDPVGTITCNGVEINITGQTRITSPTTTLSMKQLANKATILGARNPEGFIGGTCIIDGDDGGAAGPKVAQTVFVEIAENVLVGAASAPLAGYNFAIMGVQVKRLTSGDTQGRIVAPLARNAYGFEINLGSVNAGDASSAEGHLGWDAANPNVPVLYAHTIETSGGRPRADSPEMLANVAIQRADITGAGTQFKVEVRGGCVILASNATRQVKIEVPDGETAPGVTRWVQVRNAKDGGATAPCVRDPAATNGNFGTYRLRNDNFRLTFSSGAPQKVRASLVDANGVAVVKDSSGNTLYAEADPVVR